MKSSGRVLSAALGLLGGAAAGAAAMFLLDPDRGPERRFMWRERGRRLERDLAQQLSAFSRDFRSQLRGLRRELRSLPERGPSRVSLS